MNIIYAVVGFHHTAIGSVSGSVDGVNHWFGQWFGNFSDTKSENSRSATHWFGGQIYSLFSLPNHWQILMGSTARVVRFKPCFRQKTTVSILSVKIITKSIVSAHRTNESRYPAGAVLAYGMLRIFRNSGPGSRRLRLNFGEFFPPLKKVVYYRPNKKRGLAAPLHHPP
jgi:hypothetical protein